MIMPDQFPKLSEEEANHNSLFYKFVGRPNIVILNHHQWREQRKIANPAFHRSMPVYLFGKLTQKLFDQVEQLGTTVDVPDLMERWTLDAIGKAGFGLYI
jgi:cholesterol 24(S)-hydroxylase